MHRGLAGRHSSTSPAPHPRRPPCFDCPGPHCQTASGELALARSVKVVCVARSPQRSGCGRLACAKISILLQPASQEKSSLGTGRYRHLRLSTSKRETSSLPALHHNTFIARRRPSPRSLPLLHPAFFAGSPTSTLDSTRLPLVPPDNCSPPPRSIGHPCVHGLISPTGTVAMRFEI